ncbi:MAG TPA: hypothetical protein ENH34_06945 [Phycisphaerales bacterium]|nr:hypothetical protein [Phycisphaerales bacterium]
MKEATIEIEDKIDELLTCLDKDIQHIQECSLQLNELRSLVVKRNDASLGKLLETIRVESDSYRSCESQRQSIREELAIAIGCNTRQMTLSRLEAVLPKEKKAQVAERKAKLRVLTEELKKEHLSTALLLSDCARFNSLLLKSIFDLGSTGIVCYNSNGATKRQDDTAFVNLSF